MSRETLLARTLVDLADTLVADFDVVELLTGLADGCVDVLDVGAAGIMLAAPDGDLRVMAAAMGCAAVRVGERVIRGTQAVEFADKGQARPGRAAATVSTPSATSAISIGRDPRRTTPAMDQIGSRISGMVEQWMPPPFSCILP